MRRIILAAIGLIFASVAVASAQDSVAEAAKKNREKKKDAPKATKVFTNDNLPTSGPVNVVGSAATTPTAKPGEGDKEKKPGAEGEAGKDKEEKGATYWRGRFSELRGRIQQAEKELDILQREYNLMQQQYYSDPNKALREQYERKELGEQRKKIEDKQAEVRQLQQQLSDLEDELRRSGGDAGWARP